MAGTAQAAALTPCDRCTGHYVVDASGDGKPRVRCNKCGHRREVPEPAPASIPGKWTVIGPDGKAMSFDTWEELTESRRPSALQGSPDETKDIPKDKKSASALLDITPAPDKVPEKAKLALADMDSALDLGEIQSRGKRPSTLTGTPGSSRPGDRLEPLLVRSFSQAPKTQTSPKVEWAPKIDKAAVGAAPAPRDQENTLRVEVAPSTLPAPVPAVTTRVIEAERPTAPNVAEAADSIDELDPDSLLEDDTEEEESPLSLKDAMPDSSGDVLGDDDLQEDEDPPDPHELLSLRDLAVVPAVAANTSTTSQPPKAAATAAPAKAAVATSQAPPARPVSLSRPDIAPSRPPSPSMSPDRTVDDIKRRAAVSAATDKATKRGWILGAVTLLVLGGIAWRIVTSGPQDVKPPVKPTPTVATTAPVTPVTTPSPTPRPPESTVAIDLPPSATPSVTPPTTVAPPTTPDRPPPVVTNPNPNPNPNPTPPTSVATTEKPKPVVTDSPGSMSDLLDKAGAARRKGDYATARDLYQRVVAMSPGNVEANGGLGDVARAQGDLAAAKASYERALAASPTYTPAQLGLADVEWDQGNRVSATKRYAAVVDRMGDRAPQRAKERAGAGN